MAIKKIIDEDALRYYTKLMKEYIDIKIDLVQHKQTNCPNCGAVITGLKCEYCGTNFGAIERFC